MGYSHNCADQKTADEQGTNGDRQRQQAEQPHVVERDEADLQQRRLNQDKLIAVMWYSRNYE